MRKSFAFIILLITYLLNGSCSQRVSFFQPDIQYYLAHNLWYTNPKMIEYINYKTGHMIPAGTPVEILDVKLYSYYNSSISFKVPVLRKPIVVYVGPYQPGMSDRDFFNRLLTSDYSSLISGLSKSEFDNIKAGTIAIGMRKRAVILSQGFPPTHRTPTPKQNRWMYWLTKHDKFRVDFDATGRVSSIID